MAAWRCAARHAAELTHELRAGDPRPARGHDRRWQTLRRNLEAFDLRRRLGGVRTRLVAADGRLAAGWTRRRHAADASSAARRAPRQPQPAAVLGRGYAVCWNADGQVRDAADVSIGDAMRSGWSAGRWTAAWTHRRRGRLRNYRIVIDERS